MHSAPKRRIKRSIIFLRSSQLELPRFGRRLNIKGKQSFIGYAQHKDVYIELPELPVGRSMLSTRPVLTGSSEKNHTGYDVKVKYILGKESLEPSEVGILVYSRRHRINQFVEADSLHHTECMEQQRHEFYACQIHTLTKVLLHNREDLVNFDRVLEISSFHEKKRPNFSFKLLIFRDFCKLID